MRAAILAVFAILVFAATARDADAHGMRSAYIELDERAPGRAIVSIRGNVPVTGIALAAAAPCEITTDDTGRWLACPGGLAGAALTVGGMGTIVSNAVISIAFHDGTATSANVTPRDPTWTVPDPDDRGALATAKRYVRLGIEHIATGADHLLFLLGLVLCLRSLRAVLLAETAFTLSHTISFSASALGWIRVSSTAAEACIAVSLVLVALDIGRREHPDPRRVAGLAFAFGLVHGLGFAGGLREIGLPAADVPAALAGFAGGVELGQVAFLALAVGLLGLLARVRVRVGACSLADRAAQLGAYAVGGVGCLWLFERVVALV